MKQVCEEAEEVRGRTWESFMMQKKKYITVQGISEGRNKWKYTELEAAEKFQKKKYSQPPKTSGARITRNYSSPEEEEIYKNPRDF